MSQPSIAKGEIMLIEDFVDAHSPVIVKETYADINPVNCKSIPILVKNEHVRDVPYPIVCIKISFQNGSTVTYIPWQTIVPHSLSKLYIHKLGWMDEKDLQDSYGNLLLPEWCLLWDQHLRKYKLQFNLKLTMPKISNDNPEQSKHCLKIPQSANIRKQLIELDQESDATHYTMLLPEVFVLLDGKPPRELTNHTLIARFQKSAQAEMFNMPRMWLKPLKNLPYQGNYDSYIGDQEAVEIAANFSIYKENDMINNQGAYVRIIRKSISSGVPIPHLLESWESKLKDFPLISIWMKCPQMSFQLSYLPFQVIIIVHEQNLIIYYFGLLNDIRTDRTWHLLRLPGRSLFIYQNSTFSFELNVALQYGEDLESIIIVKDSIDPKFKENPVNLKSLPLDYQIIDGMRPDFFNYSQLKISFPRSGALFYYGSYVRFVFNIPVLKPSRSNSPTLHIPKSSAAASGTSSNCYQQEVTTRKESLNFGSELISYQQPNQRMTIVSGRFLFLWSRKFEVPRRKVYTRLLGPGENHIEHFHSNSVKMFQLCIELKFNNENIFLYIPNQNIIFCQDKNIIWTFEYCNIFFNCDGVLVIEGASVMKTTENSIEIVFNSHFKSRGNAVIKTTTDAPVFTLGCTDNVYLSPAPAMLDALQGVLPNGHPFEDLRVSFPLKSKFEIIDDKYKSLNVNVEEATGLTAFPSSTNQGTIQRLSKQMISSNVSTSSIDSLSFPDQSSTGSGTEDLSTSYHPCQDRRVGQIASQISEIQPIQDPNLTVGLSEHLVPNPTSLRLTPRAPFPINVGPGGNWGQLCPFI